MGIWAFVFVNLPPRGLERSDRSASGMDAGESRHVSEGLMNMGFRDGGSLSAGLLAGRKGAHGLFCLWRTLRLARIALQI